MSWSLKIGIILACLLFIYIQCNYQAKQFKQQKTISHWGKSAIYGLFIALLTACLMWGHWHEWRTYPAWTDIPIIGMVTRLAWFDPILSLKRSLPFFYNGGAVDKMLKGHSFLDWIENHFSSWVVKVFKVCYIILFVIILVVL